VGQNKNKIYPNSKEKIDFEIYNVGNVDAESVYVEMDSVITDNTPKYFIGSIEKDNYDSVTLEFTTKNIEPGEYPIQFTIKYKDSSLKEQEITKGITVTVIKNPNSASGVIIVVNIVLGIIACIISIALLVLLLRWAYKKILIPAFGGVFSKIKKKK